MYFLVEIQGSREKVKVPSKWIKDLKMCAILNYGLKYQKKNIYSVFVCADQSAEPDFHLNILQKLNIDRPACYLAKILKCYGIF